MEGTRLETWILPLDPDREAVRLAGTPIPTVLAPGRSFSVFLLPPALRDRPVLVVVRLAGDPAVIGHSVPVVALLSPTAGGRLSLATLAVADVRTKARLAALLRTPAATAGRPLGVEAAVDPNALVVRIGAPGAAALLATRNATGTALPAAPDPDRAEVLLRTLGVAPGTEAGPTVSRLAPDQGDLATTAAGGKPVTVEALRLAPGVRLVVAGLLAHGAAYADPATLVLAWIPVTGAADATDRPE